MQNISTVFLVPIPIADGASGSLSADIKNHTSQLRHYFVENIRTARRFLKALHPAIIIDEISFSEIDKHSGADINLFKQWLKAGFDIGIMSEAGCPGIADPGSILVSIAHNAGANVIPLTGPSSILLALMASGFNGQSFCFHGYLPVKDPARSQKIKALEQASLKEKQTQLFIETPYRNDALLSDLLKHCSNNTGLCIAQNITAPGSYIKTKKVADWKKDKPELGKIPAVFLMLA